MDFDDEKVKPLVLFRITIYLPFLEEFVLQACNRRIGYKSWNRQQEAWPLHRRIDCFVKYTFDGCREEGRIKHEFLRMVIYLVLWKILRCQILHEIVILIKKALWPHIFQNMRVFRIVCSFIEGFSKIKEYGKKLIFFQKSILDGV